MLTEPQPHVVHQLNKMVLFELERIGRSGPDRML